jgi:chloride channel protein, CIC family
MRWLNPWLNNWFKRLQGMMRPRQIAFVEASLIGLLSGCAAVLLKQSVGFLGEERLSWASQYPAWLILPLIGAIGGGLAGWLIERWAPDASGSGIPQVKIALAGLPAQMDMRLALVKLVSTTLSLSAGLSLGRQGPTVQIGAAIAAQVSRWFPTSPEHQRQLMAAGAAAGLAAGFNAPIAGVLFVVEELLQDASGLTLGTAILASFVGAVVSRLLGGEITPELKQIAPHFDLHMIPLLLLLGVVAGGLGVIFIRGILLSHKLQQRFLKYGLAVRIGTIGLATGLIIAVIPQFLRDSTSFQEIWNTSQLHWHTLALIFTTKFFLTGLAFGSGAPGGLFAPSLVLGSMLGSLIAEAAEIIQNLIHLPLGAEAGAGFSSTFALAGMAAFFSAVTRGPITASIIVFEMAGDFNLVLPLMISSVIAYCVGEAISSGSIYKYLIAAKGIRLTNKPVFESKLANLKALDLMQRQVETLVSDMSIDEAKQTFATSHHRGFPVVQAGELVGIITQSDLMQATIRSSSKTIADLMTVRPVTVRPHDSLSQVLYLLSRYKISRLPVVDRHKLVGIITRADIIRAESEQLTGERQQQLAQQDPSYIVYQTRDPEIGLGRLLVPISNPATAEALLKIACAIAEAKHYEVECLQVIVLPRHQSPAETPVNTAASRQLMAKATHIAQTHDIPIHTQIRVAHDPAEAILETISERHIDLLIMGWLGMNNKPGFIFGSVVDTLIRQAACSVALVKFPAKFPMVDLTTLSFDRWLLPTAGGPNSRHAMKLLPALLGLTDAPEVLLCRITATAPESTESESTESTEKTSKQDLERTSKVLKHRIDAPIKTIQYQSDSIAEAVVNLSIEHDCDVIVLGATRAGLLQQVIQGNIPETIARQSQCTVILVRTAMN